MEGKALKKAEDTQPVAPGDDNQKPQEDDQGHKATEEESPKGEKQEEFGVEDGKHKKRKRKSKPPNKDISQESAPDASSSHQPPATLRKVAVDWNGVIEIQDKIQNTSLHALDTLERAGYDIHIISYAGPKRGRQVLTKIGQLAQSSQWGRTIVPQKCGAMGKGQACIEHGCFALMDDCEEICQDALRHGIEVFPIKTPKAQRTWYKEMGGQVFKDLWDAVNAFLARHKP